MYMENGIDYIASYVCRTIMINFVELCKYVGVYIYIHIIFTHTSLVFILFIWAPGLASTRDWIR